MVPSLPLESDDADEDAADDEAAELPDDAADDDAADDADDEPELDAAAELEDSPAAAADELPVDGAAEDELPPELTQPVAIATARTDASTRIVQR